MTSRVLWYVCRDLQGLGGDDASSSLDEIAVKVRALDVGAGVSATFDEGDDVIDRCHHLIRPLGVGIDWLGADLTDPTVLLVDLLIREVFGVVGLHDRLTPLLSGFAFRRPLSVEPFGAALLSTLGFSLGSSPGVATTTVIKRTLASIIVEA